MTAQPLPEMSTGALEVRERAGGGIALNDALHAND